MASQASYLAKDGQLYSSYVEMRDANVRFNQNHLQSLGLLTMKEKKQGSQATIKKMNVKQHADHEPLRRSKRLRDVTHYDAGENSDNDKTNKDRDALVLNLIIDSEKVEHDDEEIVVKAKKKRNGTKSSKTNKDNSDDEQQQIPLQTLVCNNVIGEMEKYLIEVERLSASNVKRVMQKVALLASGEGVRYCRWKGDLVFGSGIKDLINCDFDALYNEAWRYENTYGTDTGNGWLVRHPIKKLANFQRYYNKKCFNAGK